MRSFVTYQHYKGGVYLKLCEAMHTETEETLVVYVCAVSGEVFCRPKAMFEGQVQTDNYQGPRFTPLPNDTEKSDRKTLTWYKKRAS